VQWKTSIPGSFAEIRAVAAVANLSFPRKQESIWGASNTAEPI
jgi:hypothetical protein